MYMVFLIIFIWFDMKIHVWLYERTVCLMWHCTMPTLSVVTKVHIFGVFFCGVFFCEVPFRGGMRGRSEGGRCKGETFQPWKGLILMKCEGMFLTMFSQFFPLERSEVACKSFFSLCGNGGGQESSKLILDYKVYEGFIEGTFIRKLAFRPHPGILEISELDSLA